VLAPPITNALTIDVEDYFQVSAFAPYIARSDWDRRECRVERNVQRILACWTSARSGPPSSRWAGSPSATPAWCATSSPAATNWPATAMATNAPATSTATPSARRGARQGGAGRHRRRGRQGLPRPQLLHRQGQPVGAGDAAARTGHRYSSSIYPIAHDHYGMPDAPRFAHHTEQGLLEVPVTTLRLFNRNLPSSGGGYFRLLPYGVTRWMLRRVNRSSAKPRSSTSTPGRSTRPAAHRRHRRQDALPPLRQHRPQRRQARAAAGDFRWGRMDEIFLDRSARCASCTRQRH
jgi:hypothetical protein